MPKLFAKRFYGFNPEIYPVITFSQSGSRDSLLARAASGDYMMHVAVKGDEASEEDRGMLLGLSLIGRSKVWSEDFIVDRHKIPANYYNAKGHFKWPEAIPILRAWRFTPPRLLTDILGKQLSQAARSNAVLIDEADAKIIFSLAREEVLLVEHPKLKEARIFSDVLSADFPQDWRRTAARMADTILRTVANATGNVTIRAGKVKLTGFGEVEWQLAIRKMLLAQDFRCAITGQVLTSDGGDKSWLAASVDRIDSSGHYTLDNVQIVSKAANKAKSDLAPGEVDAYFQALQFFSDRG